jgi:hypothetical protein
MRYVAGCGSDSAAETTASAIMVPATRAASLMSRIVGGPSVVVNGREDELPESRSADGALELLDSLRARS